VTGAAFAAVDLGGASGRVMLGRARPDTGRVVLQEVHRFANRPVTDAAGVLRWDVEDLWQQTLVGLSLAAEAAASGGGVLAGIGVDSWGVDYALLDAEGTLLGPPRHHRAADPAAVGRAAALLPQREHYRRTGVLPQAINTAYQLLDDTAAGLAGRAAHLLLIPDLWTYRLCGELGAERTIASTTALLGAGESSWAADVVAALGLPAGVLAGVVEPGSPAGATSAPVTRRLGTGAPVPVFRVAAHDTASAAACLEPASSTAGAAHNAVVSCGSWALAGLVTAGPVTTDAARRAGFTNEAGAWGVNLLLRNLSGLWLLQECVREWQRQDGRELDLPALLRAAEREPAGATVVDVGDERLLHPGGMPERIAELCRQGGFGVPDGRAALVRTIHDSLALAFRRAVRAAGEVAGVQVAEVHLAGGAARNRLLCQVTAQACGLPVVAASPEATSEGNVAVQLVVSGVAGSPEQARALVAPEGGPRFDPGPDQARWAALDAQLEQP
jgi:rhamnulokinase